MISRNQWQLEARKIRETEMEMMHTIMSEQTSKWAKKREIWYFEASISLNHTQSVNSNNAYHWIDKHVGKLTEWN